MKILIAAAICWTCASYGLTYVHMSEHDAKSEEGFGATCSSAGGGSSIHTFVADLPVPEVSAAAAAVSESAARAVGVLRLVLCTIADTTLGPGLVWADVW